MRSMFLFLCCTPAAWALTVDESVIGELASDENNPQYVGTLDPGINVVRGHVDPTQDSVAFDVPSGQRILSASIRVTNYQSLGNDGYARFFRNPPFSVQGDVWISGDGTYTLPGTPIAGGIQQGLTLSSAGPSGAVYDFEVTLTVGSWCDSFGVTVLRDEAVDGQGSSDENFPEPMGTLTPGEYVMCGRVDPSSDVFAFDLPAGSSVSDLRYEVSGFVSYGQDGLARFFQPSPFAVFQSAYYAADGVFDFGDPTIAGPRALGFTAASVGPFGAGYDWALSFSVDGPSLAVVPPARPVAGARNTFRATGAIPGATISFVASRTPGSMAVPGCPGLSLGIAAPPVVLGNARANAAGAATLSATIPAGVRGAVYLHAVDRASCIASPLGTMTL